MNLIINSTFTSEPLENYISWWSKAFSLPLDLKFIQYDQIFQELINEESDTSKNENGINLFLIQFEDFIRYDKSSDEVKINKIKRNYNELLEILYAKKKIVPYCFCILPVNGHKLNIKVRSYLDELNNSMSKSLAEVSDISIIDARHIHELYSLNNIFDSIKNDIAHIPYTEEYFSVLATTIFRHVQLIKQHIFKVIVVDCDNTLWKGIVSEDGAEEVEILKGYKFLQKFLIEKYEKGMLLAICSKNNEQDVWDVFEKNKKMVLKKEHFVTWKINWENKALNIREISAELNLGLDSFIFIDDSTSECFNVMTELPEVLTLCLPTNSEYIERFLKHVWAFDIYNALKNDKNRSHLYITEKQRESIRKESISLKDYLSALKLKASMTIATQNELTRISQLSMRTNQFNSTTIRRNKKEINYLLENDYIIWTIDISDNFGDYGLVGVVFSYIEYSQLIVDSFLLSCRALSRSIEDIILYGLNKFCIEKKCEDIIIKYRKTEKNQPFTDFINRSGFKLFSEIENFKLYYKKVDPNLEKIPYIDFYYKSKHEKLVKEFSTKREYYLDHVGVIVDDINKEIEYYKNLDYTVSDIICDELQNVNLVMCQKKGFLSIELIGIFDGKSPIKRIQERIGRGPYHLCFSVKSIANFLDDLKENNISYELISNKKPAILFNNKYVAFLHLKSIGIIELLEQSHYIDHEINELYSDNVIRVITSDLNAASKIYNILGYTQDNVYKETDNKLVTILMEKNNEKIELILPAKNNHNEDNLLQQLGSHPYQILFEIKNINQYIDYLKSKNLDLNIISLENQFGYISKNSKKIYSIKNLEYLLLYDKTQNISKNKEEVLWDVKVINYDNLKHKSQYLCLKYHTSHLLHNLPIYEVMHNTTNNSDFIVPRNTAERKMYNYWSEVLKTTNFGVNDNFFKIGGNSLDAVNVVAKAIVEFDITLDDIFKYETISNIVQNVKFNKNTLNTSFEKFNNVLKYYDIQNKTIELQKENFINLKEDYELEVYKLKEQNIQLEIDYQNILLVGATGYYGVHILSELLLNTAYIVYIIVRAASDQVALDRLNERFIYYFGENVTKKYENRIFVFAGDVSKTNFNMDKNKYTMLSTKIDCVINSSANVKHFGKHADFESSNIETTKRCIEFSVSRKLKDIHHISTINVAQGIVENKKYIFFNELSEHFNQKEDNIYIKSKLASENLIIDARKKGLKCNIYRAGNLAISENTKAQLNYKENAFIILIESIKNLGIIPKLYYRNIDLTYVDSASKAIVKIFNKGYLLNRNYHIYNPNKVSLNDLGEILQDFNLRISHIEIENFSEKLEDKTRNNMQDVINFVMHTSYILGNENYTNFLTQNKMTNEILQKLEFQWTNSNKDYIKKILNTLNYIT